MNKLVLLLILLSSPLMLGASSALNFPNLGVGGGPGGGSSQELLFQGTNGFGTGSEANTLRFNTTPSAVNWATFVQNGTAGLQVTVIEPGIYSTNCSYAWGASASIVISKNSNDYATLNGASDPNRLCITRAATADTGNGCTRDAYLPSGTVLRCLSNGSPSANNQFMQFSVTKIASVGGNGGVAGMVGWSSLPINAGCDWTGTSSSRADFATATCVAPTVSQPTTVYGKISAADTDLPQITISNTLAGTYKVCSEMVPIADSGSVANFYLSDGTTVSPASQSRRDNASTSGIYPTNKCWQWTYASAAASKTFKWQYDINTGTSRIGNGSSFAVNQPLTFTVEYFP